MASESALIGPVVDSLRPDEFDEILDRLECQVSIKDLQGRYLYANRLFCQFVGLSKEAVVGKSDPQLFDDQSAAEIAMSDRKLIADGEMAVCEEYRIAPREGDRRNFWVVKQPFMGNGASMVGIAAIATDITAHWRAEEALRDSERFGLAILDSIPAQIAVLDREGFIIAVNRPWRQFAIENSPTPGLPPPNTEVGTNYLNVCQSDSRDAAEATRAREGIRAVLEGESALFSMEYPCHSPTVERWFSMMVTPVENTGNVVVTHFDITGRKLAERTLADREKSFRQFFEMNTCVMLLIDPVTGMIMNANKAAVAFYGYPLESLVAMKISEINTTPPGGGAPAPRCGADGAGNHCNFVHRLASGELRHVEVYSSPIFASEKTVLFAIIHDISARRLAEEEIRNHRLNLETLVAERTAQLEESKSVAEAASRAKSVFLANMSHEIRTPINAITGMAQLIKRHGLAPVQQERMEKLEHACAHLLEIINAVLDFSKIEAGKVELAHEPFRTELVVSNAISMIFDRAKAKGLDLVVENHLSNRHFIGDATRIQQALINYLNNAVKFTEHGRIAIRVLAEAESPGGVTLRFEVTDTGIGIDKSTLSRLFGAFEQADGSTTRRYGGTGLGLAITKRLANLMGGDAGAASEPGVGSTFWFSVGVESMTNESPQSGHLISSSESRLSAALPGREILLVEDDPLNQEIAKELLEGAGQFVSIANNGSEAIALVQSYRFDLILMDMQMPVMDGLEATEKIRALPVGREIPIIAMTANAFSSDRERCIAAGMNDFISKPVNPDQLFSKILGQLQR